MEEKELKELLLMGEGQRVEFKESLRSLNEIGECVSAFSNSNNAVILIGVLDNGKLVGASVGKNTLEELAGFIKRNTDSMVFPRISVEVVQGKKVVLIDVGECGEKPVLFKGRGFKRVGKTNQRLSSAETRKLARESSGMVYWDEQICREAGLKEIDGEKVKWFLGKARKRRNLEIEFDSIEEALKKLNLIKDNKLTNACVLLFAKNPQQFFIQNEVKCARFKGTTTKEFIDMNEFSSSVYGQVDNAEKFVLKNIKKSAWIEPGKIERQEKWEFPAGAIREAITNAVVHRDYQSSSKVQVRIFDDRIEVWNPGTLPEGWSVETLKQKHESKPFNPLLARMFFLIKYIEEWGRGTTDMIRDCLDYGLPEPEFKDSGTSIIVTFRKAKLTEEMMEKLGLNTRQRGVLRYLEENNITRPEYEREYNVSKRTANRELSKLVELGLIKKKGKGPSVHYTLSGILPNLAKSCQTGEANLEG